MGILMILIPLALGISSVALGAYYWAVKSGQLDDLETPAHRVIIDEEGD